MQKSHFFHRNLKLVHCDSWTTLPNFSLLMYQQTKYSHCLCCISYVRQRISQSYQCNFYSAKTVTPEKLSCQLISVIAFKNFIHSSNLKLRLLSVWSISRTWTYLHRSIFNLMLQLLYAASALLAGQACKGAVILWESWGVFLLISFKMLNILMVREDEEANIKLSVSMYSIEKRGQQQEAMVSKLH